MAKYTKEYPLRKVVVGPSDATATPAQFNEQVVNNDGSTNVVLSQSNVRQPNPGDDIVSALVVDALLRGKRTSDGKMQALSMEQDGAGLGVLRILQAAVWAYDQTYDAQKQSIIRSEPVQVTTHNAVSVAANTLGTEVAVPMKGYSKAIIFVKSDRTYDLNYRLSDGVNPMLSVAFVSGQAATGSGARQHALQASGIWYFADTLYIQPKNTDVSNAATMTVTVYMLP